MDPASWLTRGVTLSECQRSSGASVAIIPRLPNSDVGLLRYDFGGKQIFE